MAVPNFQEFMLPILQIAGDGNEHSTSEAFSQVCDRLGLSEEDRQVLLASGIQTRARNRFSWAIVYLQRAGLLDKTRRGHFQITAAGKEVLAENLSSITYQYLMRFPSFRKFKATKKTSEAKPEEIADVATNSSVATPEERIDAAHRELTEALAAELLEKIKAAPPRFFEHLVVDLLVQMGYGGSRADTAQVVGKTGDGGIDGTIKEDKLGLDVIYIQAKRWEGSVGRKEIQAFTGSLEGERANKGVFITTSSFTAEAIDYAKKIGKKVVLIDGERLAELMIEHGVGCSGAQTLVISRVDNDYFDEP